MTAVREDGSGKRYLGSAVYDVDFFVPQGFDARVLFRDHFGIIIGDDVPVETIKLKVEASQVKYYRSLPLHHSQREIETTLDYSVFEYHLATTFDFWQEVLSKGDTEEVLEPSEFRSWIADTVANLNKTYNKYKLPRFGSYPLYLCSSLDMSPVVMK